MGNSAPINGHWRWAIVAHTQRVSASGYGYIMIYICTYTNVHINLDMYWYIHVYTNIYIHTLYIYRYTHMSTDDIDIHLRQASPFPQGMARPARHRLWEVHRWLFAAASTGSLRYHQTWLVGKSMGNPLTMEVLVEKITIRLNNLKIYIHGPWLPQQTLKLPEGSDLWFTNYSRVLRYSLIIHYLFIIMTEKLRFIIKMSSHSLVIN